MPTVLSAQNLKKIYGTTPPVVAVDGISFELKEGEILGLLGPNGSGKTTTIQMLLGTLLNTSGKIVYFGKDFSAHRSEILQHVTFASTYTSMPWILTIAQNLEVCGYLYGLNSKESRKAFDPLLERFGILEKKNHRVSTLSAGQVTRLMLVKAFFPKPKVVLLDEPTASLDPDIAHDICNFILEQREKQGVSILFTSHKMEEVMAICNRAIFLKEGKIIANDTPRKLAKSVSTFKLKLIITDGIKRTISLVKEKGYAFSTEHRGIEIMMDEDQIPPFLHALSQANVCYATIKIEEPSLEDFFMQIARKG